MTDGHPFGGQYAYKTKMILQNYRRWTEAVVKQAKAFGNNLWTFRGQVVDNMMSATAQKAVCHLLKRVQKA